MSADPLTEEIPLARWACGVPAVISSVSDRDASDLREMQRLGLLPGVLVTVEAGATFGWERFAGDEGTVIGIDRFGASAPAEETMKRFGFTAERITAAALRLLGRQEEAEREEPNQPEEGEAAVAATSPAEGHS